MWGKGNLRGSYCKGEVIVRGSYCKGGWWTITEDCLPGHAQSSPLWNLISHYQQGTAGFNQASKIIVDRNKFYAYFDNNTNFNVFSIVFFNFSIVYLLTQS